MNARIWPLATLILGLVTLGFFVALGSQPAVTAIYERTEVSQAVSLFQRAESSADLVQVFGFPVDERVVAAQNAINTLDLWGFIPAYALFLAAAAIMLGGLKNRWTQVAVVFALLGAAADAVETWKQLQITADLENAEAHLPIALWHWLKYLALALNGVAVASIALTAEKRRVILAVIALLPLPLVVASYADLLSTRVFAGAFGLYWVTLLALAGVELFRKPAAT
ncbi:MAG: hypothetical protein K2X34_07855 [Hyphomonadaceae bacterium]|nr:hypothetical protein [Hyphomonadaceae bacterium]